MTIHLQMINKLEVIALMDNVSDPFTKSHPNMRWNESQYRINVLKKEEFSGADFCRACNGLSLFMRLHTNSKTHTLLFDATNYAKKLTGINKVHLVMGGFHLAPPEVETRVNPMLNDFSQLNPDYIISGHYTGAKTQAALTAKFPDKHITYGVGTVFRF